MRISLKKQKSRFASLVRDCYRIEKHDIEDPAWENAKKLVTDEEIKKKVRAFWNSNVVPDPNKNLTFHSYKAKREATSPGNPPPSKRRRICPIDNEIELLEEEKEIEASACVEEMEKEMNLVSKKYDKKRLKLNLKSITCKSKKNRYKGKKMCKLDRKRKKCMSLIIKKFQKLVNKIDTYFLSKICKLRAEQSENFDENGGLVESDNEELDCTMTTDSEIQAKINNIYELFDMYYR